MGGSDGHIQDNLQEAIRTVEECVTPRGMPCSPQKLELPLITPAWLRKSPFNIELHSQGFRIPVVQSIRVLGLHIQADGRNGETINILNAATYQISRLIARIAGRSYGMREKNLGRLDRAFVVSRLACVIPFLKLGVAEETKVECLIRKAYQRALRPPDSTSNEKLAALGLHNTIDKLIEAQRTSQLETYDERNGASHSQEPRPLLRDAARTEGRHSPTHQRKAQHPTLTEAHASHPVHHVERRTARAKALKKQLKTEKEVIFVDAAEYDKKLKAMTAVAVDREGLIIASCSVRMTKPEVADLLCLR